MGKHVIFRVYRNFDNRKENLSDDSPMAFELHKKRAICLHRMLDNNPYWKVVDWGKTDDNETHEVIDTVLDVLSNPAVIESAKYLGNLLAAAGVSAAVSEGVKWLFKKVRPQQETRQITNVFIKIPPATQIQIDSPDSGGRIYLSQQLTESGDRAIDEDVFT